VGKQDLIEGETELQSERRKEREREREKRREKRRERRRRETNTKREIERGKREEKRQRRKRDKNRATEHTHAHTRTHTEKEKGWLCPQVGPLQSARARERYMRLAKGNGDDCQRFFRPSSTHIHTHPLLLSEELGSHNTHIHTHARSGEEETERMTLDAGFLTLFP